jgi:hypothetical protein
MYNPASDDPICGHDAVSAALRAVERATDTFEHTQLLVSPTDSSTYALVFEAQVGDSTLHGVDLLHVDERRDLIDNFTVIARPLSALMALGARISSAD